MLSFHYFINNLDSLTLELEKSRKDIENYFSEIEEDIKNNLICDSLSDSNVFDFFDFDIEFNGENLYFSYDSMPDYKIFDLLKCFLLDCYFKVKSRNTFIKVVDSCEEIHQFYYGIVTILKDFYVIETFNNTIQLNRSVFSMNEFSGYIEFTDYIENIDNPF